MRHDSVVTKWDAVLALMLTGGLFSTFYMSIHILLAAYWTFFASVWMETYSSPLEVAVIGSLGMLFYLALFQVVLLLFGIGVVVFTPRMKRGILGRHTFEIRELGLSEVTPHNEALHAWSAVDRVFRFGKRTYVRIGGTNWFVIPDRDFAGPEHANAFCVELRRRADA